MMYNNSYNYVISDMVHHRIDSFYDNVSKKYPNTYSKENERKNCQVAYNSIFRIENGLLRQKARFIPEWIKKGYFMATCNNWAFAYTINGDTINVVDARHAQNMHEEVELDIITPILELMNRMDMVRTIF